MDRNTLLALLMVAIVLILTPYYLELVSPTPPRGGDTLFVDQIERLSETPGPVENISDQKETPFLPASESFDEQVTIIETDLYLAEISSRNGGSLNSFILKNYLGPDSQYVDLITPANQENLFLGIKNLDAESFNLSPAWRVNGVLGSGYITAPTSLEFFTTIDRGKEITKTITFYPGSYLIDIETDLSSCKNDILSGVYSFSWYGGLPPTEKNSDEDQTYFSGYVYQGGELDATKASSGEKVLNSYKGDIDWVAIRTKYFLSAILPSNPSNVVSATIGATIDKHEKYDITIVLPADEPYKTLLYLGPLEYSRISSIGKNLDLVMNFGWFFIIPISKGVLWLLKNMHDYIPNYGVVLVLFSILVKVVVYPLTKKSYQSTQAMQLLQPEIASLREKYKNNSQKLNQATMALYKKRGVNPLGGCLPMVLQMPLLFALFTVFRSTIELRGEPFIFWIKDLSAPDIIFNLPFTIPIYGNYVCALPMLMALSMFVQQKMMSGGAMQQAQQKVMQYSMMVFFFLIFNSFPSGLNLYYTLFNVLTIIQQKYVPAAKNTELSS